MRKAVKPRGAYGLRKKGKNYRSVYTHFYILTGNLPLFLNCILELVIFEMEQFRVLKRMCV